MRPVFVLAVLALAVLGCGRGHAPVIDIAAERARLAEIERRAQWDLYATEAERAAVRAAEESARRAPK